MVKPDIALNDAPPHSSSLFDHIGTSTDDSEAVLRDIGRAAFGIRYPRDVTPRKLLPLRIVLK